MDTKKIVLSLLIILIAINIIFLPISYASTLDDIFDSADDFVESGEDPESVIDKDNLETPTGVNESNEEEEANLKPSIGVVTAASRSKAPCPYFFSSAYSP